jgi:hypothetical protein
VPTGQRRSTTTATTIHRLRLLKPGGTVNVGVGGVGVYGGVNWFHSVERPGRPDPVDIFVVVVIVVILFWSFWLPIVVVIITVGPSCSHLYRRY